MTTTNPLALASTDTLRNANLEDLVALLRTQAELKYDVVVNAKALRYDAGLLAVDGGALRFGDDGVEEADARLRPTLPCEEALAGKLEIPTRYVRKMRADAITQAAKMTADDVDQAMANTFAADLLDHNVNHWLGRDPNRKFLVRAFRNDNPDEVGVARAVLSDQFGMYDHLDMLVAALDGVKQSGTEITIEGCDLSEKRMQVRITAPAIKALAPSLLAGYRTPFGTGGIERVRNLANSEGMGYEPGEEPVVFAGFVISNSETGDGALTIMPQVIIQICRNGLRIKGDALKSIHLGSKLEDGVIRWSGETQRKGIELVTARAKDAVTTFLDVAYIERVVARLDELAGKAIAEPEKMVERVGKQFGFSEDEQNTILRAFIAGGQLTAGGVMQAVTAAAQTIEDPDRAADLEESAEDVLAFAAR